MKNLVALAPVLAGVLGAILRPDVMNTPQKAKMKFILTSVFLSPIQGPNYILGLKRFELYY